MHGRTPSSLRNRYMRLQKTAAAFTSSGEAAAAFTSSVEAAAAFTSSMERQAVCAVAQPISVIVAQPLSAEYEPPPYALQLQVAPGAPCMGGDALGACALLLDEGEGEPFDSVTMIDIEGMLRKSDSTLIDSSSASTANP